MKSTPILFNGAMVRAILDGRKTQTRRIGKCQLDSATELGVEYCMHATRGLVAQATYRAYPDGGTARWALCDCPYGVPGDRLWVRETFRLSTSDDCACYEPCGCKVGVPIYRASIPDEDPELDPPWKPSIHMPRWASRLTLEITGIRVERLQDISEADAKAEGVKIPVIEGCYAMRISGKFCPPDYWPVRTHAELKTRPDYTAQLLRSEYAALWDSITHKDHSWDKNPWVWVGEFRKA